MDETAMPPRTDKKEPMEQVTLQVPVPMLKELDDLASGWGVSRNEVFRRAIAEGMPGLLRQDLERLERQNKLLVQEKLKRRPECIRTAIALLESGGDPAEIKRLLEESIG
jgi:Ribbon-helix-helix protein, copG family